MSNKFKRSAQPLALTFAISLCSSLAAQADVLDLDTGSPSPTAYSKPVPFKGLSKQQVLKRYGQPQRREAAVGDPPISVWHYSGYKVYFEYNLVLHSVVQGAPPVFFNHP